VDAVGLQQIGCCETSHAMVQRLLRLFASAHTAQSIHSKLDAIARSAKRKKQMSYALAYAMLLIHQHQAHNLDQQHNLQQLFLTFLAGQLTADQYERDLRPDGSKPCATRCILDGRVGKVIEENTAP